MPLHFPTTLTKKSVVLTVISILLFGCSQSVKATLVPVADSTPSPTNTPPAVIKYSGENNFIFLSIEENGYAHLFIQSENPLDLPLTRITTGKWNDIAPALSPDRTQLAFASDRSGFWDLYVMDLKSGDTINVNLKTGRIENLRNKQIYNAEPFSDVQFEVYQKGGLLGK